MDADWGLVAEGAGGELLASFGQRDRLPTGRCTRAAHQARRASAQVAPGAAFGREVCWLRPRSWRSRRSAAADASGRPEAAVRFPDCEPAAWCIGVGGGLRSRRGSHLAQTGAAGYYLITDDTCDVGFPQFTWAFLARWRKLLRWSLESICMSMARSLRRLEVTTDDPVRGVFVSTPSGRMHLGNVFRPRWAWLSVRSVRTRSCASRTSTRAPSAV